MGEQTGSSRSYHLILTVVLVLGGIPLLLFLPLLLSIAEAAFLGTEHVGQFFRALGLGQFLIWFYGLFGI